MNRLTRLVGVAVLAAAGECFPAETPPVSCIDTHNHLVVGRGGGGGYDGAVAAALRAMEAHGITKMLVMPPPFPRKHPMAFEADALLPALRKHPGQFDFLAGGGTLMPMIQEAVGKGATSNELRDRFRQQALALLKMGALGFGEFAAEHFSLGPKHGYQSAPPDHPLFLLLADIAAEHDVPIDLHMECVPKDMPLPKHLLLRRTRRR